MKNQTKRLIFLLIAGFLTGGLLTEIGFGIGSWLFWVLILPLAYILVVIGRWIFPEKGGEEM